jgi:asparagine synthase (glutamine-hydrolysing)
LSTPSYLLACTKYKEYPVCSFETQNFYICVEGQIYGKNASALRAELNDVAILLFEDPSDTKGLVKKWLVETNGEFILFFVKKDSNEIAVLSDALGHLPLYYCKLNGIFLLSREMRFIAGLLNSFKIDKAAFSQYLVFCYPLGQRSFLENVSRLGANGFVQVCLNSGKINVRRLFELNLEQKQYANRTLQSNANHLIEILTEECKAVTRSFDGFVNVLALSGGLDSRIVMLAMREASMPFCTATRLGNGNSSARDVEVARQLAKLYQLDWRLFELQSPKFRDALKLLHMKNGLNYLAMSFILSFFERIREYYGHSMIYWTGDSGLVVRRELPDERLRTYDDLLDRILREHQIFDPNDIARLLQTDVKTLRAEIKNVLEAYPEQSLEQKYVHFVMYGRTMNWHYEGMDRNRCYFWLSAPLEFTTFFNYAMNCPDTQKTNYRLYRAILGQMSPESCRIAYAQYGLAPASFLFPIVLKMNSIVQKMSPSVRSRLKTLLRQNREGVRANSLITECIKQQINNCPILREYLSNKYTESLLQRSNASQKKVLLTVTSAIEDLTTSKSCLEDYQEEDFT